MVLVLRRGGIGVVFVWYWDGLWAWRRIGLVEALYSYCIYIVSALLLAWYFAILL